MEGLSSPLPLREGDKDPYTVTTVYPKNAIAFFDKRNPLMKTFRGRLWPNTASKLTVQILTYLKQYAPFCPAIFSLSLAQILRLHPKNKNQMHFSGLYQNTVMHTTPASISPLPSSLSPIFSSLNTSHPYITLNIRLVLLIEIT